MKIVAAVIGMGVGEKHLEAIDGFMGSKVKIICEKNKKKIQILKKKYPNKLVTSKEEDIFLEHKLLWNYQFSTKYTLSAGYKLTHGNYPYGNQWDFFPLIDLSWIWKK